MWEGRGMSKDLKPCPFCGGEAVIRETRFSNNYTIGCTAKYRCLMHFQDTSYSSKDEMISLWNQRIKPCGKEE